MNGMKKITVVEFLAKTKGKNYKLKNSDMPELVSEIEGNDIPKSFRMDTVEQILSYDNGGFVLDYGKKVPRYWFGEIIVRN